MLLIASPAKWSKRDTEGMICLSMPLKVHELLSTAYYIRNRIKVHYSPITAAWNIENKNADYNNVAAGVTYQF